MPPSQAQSPSKLETLAELTKIEFPNVLDRSGAENLLAYFCRELRVSTSFIYQEIVNLGDRLAIDKCETVRQDHGTEKLDGDLTRRFAEKRGLAFVQFSFTHPKGRYRGFGGLFFPTIPGYKLEYLPREQVETMRDLHRLTIAYFSNGCPPVIREQVNND